MECPFCHKISKGNRCEACGMNKDAGYIVHAPEVKKVVVKSPPVTFGKKVK